MIISLSFHTCRGVYPGRVSPQAPARRQVKLLMKAADSRCCSLVVHGPVPGSEPLLTLARKSGRNKKKNKTPNSPSGALLQLVPASHGVRVSPAPRADTHTSVSIHGDAARRILLDVTADSRVTPPLSLPPQSRNPGVRVARTGTSLQQRAVVERTHATVHLRGDAWSNCKQQDRWGWRMIHIPKVTGSPCAVAGVCYRENNPQSARWHPASCLWSGTFSTAARDLSNLTRKKRSINMFWSLCEGPLVTEAESHSRYATARFTKLERHLQDFSFSLERGEARHRQPLIQRKAKVQDQI